MNICFLLNGFSENGGIGRAVSILADRLSWENKNSIHALSFFDEGKPDFFPLDERIARRFIFDKPITMKKAMIAGGVGRLRGYLKRNQIDILVACGALYFPLSILACMHQKTRCICWEHSNIHTIEDHAFQRICRWSGAKAADGVVLLTKRDYGRYIKKYKRKGVYQIYNPIDPAISKGNDGYRPDSKKIISAGRLSPPKNYETLIEIAGVVLSHFPEWQWDIYGEGELHLELDRRIRDRGLQNRLFLKGQRENLYDLYKEYSFLVMTSLREGFPMVLLEAGASSLPLISFDIDTGPDEIIQDGVNGYLISAFDRDEMIDRIEALMQDRELRIAMAASSRELIMPFQLEGIHHQWQEIFNDLAPKG